MLCPSCGADCGEQIRLCDRCQAKRPQQASAGEQTSGYYGQPEHHTPVDPYDLPYAGFWLRVCSALVDGAVLLLLTNTVIWIVGRLFQFSLQAMLEKAILSTLFGLSSNFLFFLVAGYLASILSLLAVVFGCCTLYYILFECSRWQATLGKRFAGTIVTDLEGRPISHLRATARYLLKLLSGLPFGLGFLCPLVTDRKQTLHDLISGCVTRERDERPVFNLVFGSVVAIIVIFVLQRVEISVEPKPPSKVIYMDGRSDGGRTWKSLPTNSSSSSNHSANSFPSQPALQRLPEAAVQPTPMPTAGPTVEPTLEPEPVEQFDGPHARIRSQSTMFDAKTVIAFYYKQNNSVAIGFYPEEITAAQLGLLKQRAVIAKASESNRPLLTMLIVLDAGIEDLSARGLVSYTASFFRDHLHRFKFNSLNDAVSFSKSRSQIEAEDRWQLSGKIVEGGRFKLITRGSGAPKTNPDLRFRWDVQQEVLLVGIN